HTHLPCCVCPAGAVLGRTHNIITEPIAIDVTYPGDRFAEAVTCDGAVPYRKKDAGKRAGSRSRKEQTTHNEREPCPRHTHTASLSARTWLGMRKLPSGPMESCGM